MKKFTTVAVIVALALASQVFAMGSSTKGGQTMSSTTMKTSSAMRSGNPTMTAPATMNGTVTMTTAMSGTGMTKSQTIPTIPMQPVVTK